MSKAESYIERLRREMQENKLVNSLKKAANGGRREVVERAMRVRYQRDDEKFRRVTPGYIVNLLAEMGFEVEYYAINRAAYQNYLTIAQYATIFLSSHNGPEKTLEHFVSLEFLNLQVDDVLLDVGGNNSPFVTIAEKASGCQVYRHDVNFATGINGQQIGGEVASIPLPDGAISKITVHAAFETFESNKDTSFIKEAARLLRPGGKLYIVPLQISDQYYIVSDPLVPKGNVEWDENVPVVYRPRTGNRFGRQYNVAQVVRRVLRPAKAAGLKANLYYVPNAPQINPACTLKFFVSVHKVH